MKVELYNYIKAAQKMNRRQMLKGSAALGAVAMMPQGTLADGHSNVRAEILKIPGVGAGSPTDSDWQRLVRCAWAPPKATLLRVSLTVFS